MGNVMASYPTFGAYKHLLSAPTDAEWTAINEWYFEHISKCCLLTGGFLPVIRKQEGDTLFVKLYYVEDRVKENKREIEQFVSSFYLHEPYNLNYSRCNIIRIPLKLPVNETTVHQLRNAQEAEALIQWQLNETSWVGVDHSGTQGGLTLDPITDKQEYEQRKRALLDGVLNVCFEKRISRNPEYTVINRAKEGYKISVKKDQFILGWDSVGKEHVSHSIEFIWNGISFGLTGLAYYGSRSNRIEAQLNYFNQSTRFGYGRSIVGAGAIGHIPNVIVGNTKLKFTFGNNWISVSEVAVGPRTESDLLKSKGSFEFIF